MTRELILTADPIDEAALVASRTLGGGHGAVVAFSGVVRGQEEGAPIQAIEYEAFEKMVRHQFGILFDEVEQRWPVASIRLVHRTGRVAVTEASLWVEVVTPHRGEAFAACQYLIDEMKKRVPIWKKILA
jgi:molybdopterin synthase catalytic subunit